MTSQSPSPPEDLEAQAMQLLEIAQQKDHEARVALEAAEVVFRLLGKPLPLFDRLEGEGR